MSLIPFNVKDELAKLIKSMGLVKQGEFSLKSGAKTNAYTDIRSVAMCPLGRSLVTEVLFARVYPFHSKNYSIQIGGMAVGSIPIVCSLAGDYDCFYVRKDPKPYGLSKRIEGVFHPDYHTVIVEDVVSTGSTVFELMEILKETNTPIEGVVALVDRPNDRDKPLDFGVPYKYIYTLEELL